MDLDFRSKTLREIDEDETRWKPRTAVNDDDTDSFDSDDDEAIRAAKRCIY